MAINRFCFGTVPSRRLGRSLGINNVTPKSCSYSCIYCQLGPTKASEVEPRDFYAPEKIRDEVVNISEQLRSMGEPIDYLTFVPDGEPTLDAHLGNTIALLRSLEIPIAVISNASLIWREDIHNTLLNADWVSLKLDAVDDAQWTRINRPHPALNHQTILQGMKRFAQDFKGTLVTETMLVKGLNDNADAALKLATFLGELAPAKAYLSIPIRPPAEKSVEVPQESALNLVYQIVSEHVNEVELLTGYEGTDFAHTGDLVTDLLAITAVHPMREEAMREFLVNANADWRVIERLLAEHELIETEYHGQKFYLRRFQTC